MSRQVTASLAGLVSSERPSIAISSSVYSIPAAVHFSISLSLIGREAPAMSASPPQNFPKPSPVPGPSTVASS